MSNRCTVPVIDLFAGPGGLGEGFSALESGPIRFRVTLSIEKDPVAHKTLELRSFFRQFRKNKVPSEYYAYLRGEVPRDVLFDNSWTAFKAESSSLLAELGVTPSSHIDDRIKEALVDANQFWVLIGGPPCQAYSVVGRSRMRPNHKEQFEADHRHFLYREYLRILAKFRPDVFVLENVKGLLSATVKGQPIFDRIRADLSNPRAAIQKWAEDLAQPASNRSEYRIHSLVVGKDEPSRYEPGDFVIEAERFGIPQKRHRVILIGIHKSLCVPDTMLLEPSPSPTVGDVLGGLPRLRSRLSDTNDSYNAWSDNLELAWGNALRNCVAEPVRECVRKALQVIGSESRWNARCIEGPKLWRTEELRQWYADDRIGAVCNHEPREHMRKDLVRYLFASCYGRGFGRSPKLHEFPEALLPDHRNVARALQSRHGFFNDRFRVQVANDQATTVTSHISKDGHGFIHDDPAQCRSWTVREAARIQTFPDNYFFEGTRTDQYRQVGNAVPPLLAAKIASKVAQILMKPRSAAIPVRNVSMTDM